MISVRIVRDISSGPREFRLDVQIESDVRRIVLFGPSGSGKTLTAQAIAGLLRPDRGQIRVGDTVLYDSDQGVFLPPQQRQLGYLQQDYGLFPHLTVAQNIVFGLRKGWLNPRRDSVPDSARRWIDAFELEPVLQSYPAQISGGQKQRTALARALAVEPRLLVLDEPLSALDFGLRHKMREELAGLQAKLAIPTILITHDPEDARMLADQVYHIEHGKIVGESNPDQLHSRQSSTPSMTLDALNIA